MRFEHVNRYAAGSDAVLTMLTTPAFREEVCVRQRALDHDVDVTGAGPGAVVLIARTQSMEGAPGVATKVAGDTVRIVQREEWRTATEADFVMEIPGKPGQLKGGIVAQINSSWTTRVRRDDLVTFHVDGTHGSAVCGLTDCWTQGRVNTPKPVWNPDVPQTINFFEGWQKVPDTEPMPNGFRVQWELFLRHVAGEVPDYPWDLMAGAKGVQLAEAGLRSWAERRWIDLPALEA